MKVSVRHTDDPDRSSCWCVRYRQNGKDIRRFFETKELAETAARDVRKLASQGANPEDVAEALRLLAGTGYRLAQIASIGLQHLRDSNASKASPSATFDDGVSIVLARSQNRRRRTALGYRNVFAILSKTFGRSLAISIGNDEVQKYLDMLPDRKGEPGKASAFTKKSVLNHIKMVLRAVGIVNPLPRVRVTIPTETEIKYFEVEDIRTILQEARPHERGLVVLATFAAIRPETLERLPANCVSVQDRTIRIPAELSKDHKPHLLETVTQIGAPEMRPGPPPILWTWLDSFPFAPTSWNSLQRRLRKALGYRWIQDGLRHTGATYFRAIHGDAPTAELLTHTTIKLVRDHYGGLASRAKAERFYSLTVESVLSGKPQPNPSRKQVAWPSNERLEQMLLDAPGTQIAKTLGCSDSMLTKHCRKNGINKPSRGYWTGTKSQSKR